MALLPVADALARLLAGAAPLGQPRRVPLAEAAGRVLAAPLARAAHAAALRRLGHGRLCRARRRRRTAPAPPARDRRRRRPAARFAGRVGAGEAVRIFTGAPVPDGADTIAHPGECRRVDGDGRSTCARRVGAGRHIRRARARFRRGRRCCSQPGRVLDPARARRWPPPPTTHALAVVRRPLVAILATGDELLPPGSTPGPDQIIASNAYGVAAHRAAAGADVARSRHRARPPGRDRRADRAGAATPAPTSS